MKDRRTPSALAVGQAAWRHFRADGCPTHAASIAFFGLLSLLPLAALALLLVGFLFGPADAHDARWLVDRFPAAEPRGEILDNLRRAARPEGPEALPLVATMLLAGSLVFGALQTSFAAVFDASPRRTGYLWGRLRALLLMVGSTLVLVGLFAAHQAILALAGSRWLPAGLLGSPVPSVVIGWGVSMLGEFLGFFGLMRSLPPVRVRNRAAVVGSALTVVGWEALKVGFAWWAPRAWARGLIYGPLEAVTFVALWLYLASTVLLFGAEVAAVLNRNRSI